MGDGPGDAYRAQCEYEKLISQLAKAYEQALQNKDFVDLIDCERCLKALIKKEKEVLDSVIQKRDAIVRSLGVVDDRWEDIDFKMAVAEYERKKNTR